MNHEGPRPGRRPGKSARITWNRDFYANHRTEQTLVLLCPVDLDHPGVVARAGRAHKVGELRARSETDEDPGGVSPVIHRRRGLASRLEFTGPGNRRLEWQCPDCFAAGRRDTPQLRSERVLEIIELMRQVGPPKERVVLDPGSLAAKSAELRAKRS